MMPKLLNCEALIKDFVEEIQDIALSCSHLLQLFSHNLSLTKVDFNQDSQQWTFTDLLKVTDHPLCFQRAKWARNSLLFGISTNSTLYFGRVGDLEGLSDKTDLDLDDLAAVNVVRVAGISDFAFSPDESVVAVGTKDGTVYFYSTADASLLHKFEFVLWI
jgi:WD40 repeat protein